jgi:uncharacterized protein YjbI with pentapeptide repeats
MSHEIKIEKKASEVIQPSNEEEARLAIRTRQDLSGARLQGMVLDNINAVGSILRKTDLANADLSHGLLINPNFYKASLHGTAAHNTIILGGDLVKTSCKGTDLSHSAIIGTDAQEASFEGANLNNAALVSTNFQDADFTRADLSNTRLASLDVTGADFSDAILSGSRAYNVNWEQAKVPPIIAPEPLVKLPNWAWSVLLGSLFGFIALILYSLLRKKNKRS